MYTGLPSEAGSVGRQSEGVGERGKSGWLLGALLLLLLILLISP